MAEMGKGLNGARGAQRSSGQALTCSTTPRFRETKTIGPGSGQGSATDSCATLGKSLTLSGLVSFPITTALSETPIKFFLFWGCPWFL